MSKTALKKELKHLSEEQVKELVLDLYSSCKEAREYLDFFVDPDADKLFEKHLKELTKEARRTKHSMSTARISRIRGIIRHFESFNAGAECTLKFMQAALAELLDVEYRLYVKQPFINGIVQLTSDILGYGEAQMMFDTSLKIIDTAIQGNRVSTNMRKRLRNEVMEYMALAKPLHK